MNKITIVIAFLMGLQWACTGVIGDSANNSAGDATNTAADSDFQSGDSNPPGDTASPGDTSIAAGDTYIAAGDDALGGDTANGDTASGDSDILAGDTAGGDSDLTPQLPAFPGAMGFGALATGGRGGRVIKVTTLNRDGPGSLQEALNQNEPRIIVFAVSGIIDGGFDPIEVTYGNVTIAGQTAPGAGITIQGRLYGAYDFAVNNIIIRHLRIRPRDISDYSQAVDNQYDAVQFSRNGRLILDHISASFGADETIDLYSASDVTVQWSTIAEASINGEPGGGHNYGLINGPDGYGISLLNNLFANNSNRNPAITNGPAEIINNVIYNVRHGFVHHNPASGNFNITGNYYKQGPNDSMHPFFFDATYIDASYYVSSNYIEDPLDGVDGMIDNPWTNAYFTMGKTDSVRSATLFDFSIYPARVDAPAQSATAAYDSVLASAGAFPRDFVDLRDVSETQDNTGSWGARIPSDLMDGLVATSAPLDTDDDGMPDSWESGHGLNPAVADDSAIQLSGYTAIEEYINELADTLVSEATTIPTPGSFSDSFDGSGVITGYVTNNLTSLPTIEQVDGRYRADLTDNGSNITLHFNAFQGRLDAQLVTFPFEAIARNIGIGTQADSQVAPSSSGSPYIFAGLQIHVTDLESRNSSHVVVGHRGGTQLTVEGKNTLNGSSSVNDEGPNSAPSGRADIRIVGTASNTLVVYWQVPNLDIGNQADSWQLYGGDGILPGTAPAYATDVYVGLITYAQGSTGLPFVGTCDSLTIDY